MPEATRIRAQTSGDRTVVRLRMSHEMDNGLRRDSAGKLLPVWFIQEFVVTLNGRPVLNGQWGPSIAKDPYLQLVLRGAKPGDRVGVRWVDNRGEQRSDESVVV